MWIYMSARGDLALNHPFLPTRGQGVYLSDDPTLVNRGGSRPLISKWKSEPLHAGVRAVLPSLLEVTVFFSMS